MIELSTTPVHRRDLLVKLTDDTDPYFLFTLPISEEDFQSLKVQQGLLIDFASFPQKFIDLLNLCNLEQDSDNPRFLLHLTCQSTMVEGCATFSIVETNAFKHLNHLSLRLIQGSEKEVKEYLAACLASLKAEKQALDRKFKETEDDLCRQLSYTQQTLSEKTKELEKLRSEWTNKTSSLSSRHSEELQLEREKNLELQSRFQHETERLRQDLEAAHRKSSQQLQSRVTDLETSCRELTERRYKNESIIRDLKIKLSGSEEECQRLKQQVLSLRRENSTLDTEVHEKERVVSQLQVRVAVLEQEVKDKEMVMYRTKEVLEATQQQKESVEESAENKEVQLRKLEATVKSLSEELLKVKELEEQLEMTLQKLNESKEVLKTNENVINWLNKQLNEVQLSKKSLPAEPLDTSPGLSTLTGLRVQFHPQPGKPAVLSDATPADHRVQLTLNRQFGDSAGLDPKYFSSREDGIPAYSLSSNIIQRELALKTKPSGTSAYFSS
ncbi:PREDICTED: spindle assembly abnormal protein 6 homolog isoform X2 [Poecilia mexicana]|nr:PREDICTED: spindle assembly abnormal protein 6 homolog isoform X2 [Poecilia mexicana]